MLSSGRVGIAERPGRPARPLSAAVGTSLLAASALILTVSVVAEIAAGPTSNSGISSSTWTPTTAVTALVFGQDAFHGSFAPASIAFGWLAIGFASVIAAGPGIALLVYSLGWRPQPLAAALFGAAWGLAAEIAIVNLLLNWIQAEDGVYRSLPSWGWWVGMAAWGAILGLSTARLGRRAAPLPYTRGAPA